MTLFGKKKFGAFKFGPTTLTQPRYGLEVDWDGNFAFDGSNEGVNLQDISIERGRQYTFSSDGESYESEETGRFSAALIDEERRYDPYNEASPLFGMLTGGKFFRVKIRTTSGGIYYLMTGALDEPVSYSERGMFMARLKGSDGWAFLRNQKNEVTVPLKENIYVDDAIRIVLDEAGWPRVWGDNLNLGVDQKSYFWVDARSAAQVIHELAHNELGNVNVSASGQMSFQSRLDLQGEVLIITDTDVIHVERMSPSDVIRNVIKVRSTPRTEAAVQTVWEIPLGSRLEVAPGETIDDVFAEFTYGGESVPVKNPITPVSVTDFDATQNEDGSGSNYTADVSISIYPYSTTAQLSITNSGASTAWVYARVRGTPIIASDTVSFGHRDAASIKQFGPRPFNLDIDQNVNVARQYKELLASILTQSKDYLVVDLMPAPDVQFAADLGQIVRARLDNYGIDRAYRLIRIKHKFLDVNGIVVNTRWWLEPFVRLFTGVQLPVQVPFQLGA